MKECRDIILFVGNNENLEYLQCYKGRIIAKGETVAKKKYSLTYISDDIEVLCPDEAIIVEFNRKDSNSSKEAYIAYLIYKKLLANA